jgi:hypothetical protein
MSFLRLLFVELFELLRFTDCLFHERNCSLLDEWIGTMIENQWPQFTAYDRACNNIEEKKRIVSLEVRKTILELCGIPTDIMYYILVLTRNNPW